MDQPDLSDELRGAAAEAWRRYLRTLDGLRPDLFRYCRRLTGNVWDAEDLVQDTLEQGFAKLGTVGAGIANPRGYVLRIASNLWLTRVRRMAVAEAAIAARRIESLDPKPAAEPSQGMRVREAGVALLTHLAPQERAAIVLKETFDLTAAEIAEVLGTTEGAIKAALHRGRSKIKDIDVSHAGPAPDLAVLDRFVERFNARDLPGLLELMLDHATIEMPGTEIESGRAAYTRKPGWFYYNLHSPFDGGATESQWETAMFQGEPIVLVLSPRDGRMAVTSVMRFQTDADCIARIRVYAHCPDAVREVAATLERPVATMGLYRFPFELVPHLVQRARASHAQSSE